MDPFTAWLLLKSLETYPLRIEQLCKNASRIAFFLKDHPKIQKTIFPGLSDFSQKKLVEKVGQNKLVEQKLVKQSWSKQLVKKWSTKSCLNKFGQTEVVKSW